MSKKYCTLFLLIGVFAGFTFACLWPNDKSSFRFDWSGREAFFIQPKENVIVIKTGFGYFHLSSLTGHVDLRYKNNEGSPLIHFFHDLDEYYPKYLTRLIEPNEGLPRYRNMSEVRNAVKDLVRDA
ncbi:MAG: hypothetical protein LAT58_05215 [Opitutales bacterium]|nr:hypothetical protein [Opitutales bacterium]